MIRSATHTLSGFIIVCTPTTINQESYLLAVAYLGVQMHLIRLLPDLPFPLLDDGLVEKC